MSGNSIPVAANVLGTIGTVLWCIQLVPQIWHNWHNKKTDGLPWIMMFLWALCAVPFGVYMIVQQVNIPIQVQPHIFGVLALVSTGQIMLYNHGWSVKKASLFVVGMSALFGGVEALLILTIRIPYRKGITWPNLVVGIVATILVISGLIPPYFELWKRRGRVVGINFVFLSTDTFGALFSLFALVAQNSFDILGGVLYIFVVVLEIGIMMSHVIWLFRHRKAIKEAKAKGVSIDEFLGLHAPATDEEASPAGDVNREVDDPTKADSNNTVPVEK